MEGLPLHQAGLGPLRIAREDCRARKFGESAVRYQGTSAHPFGKVRSSNRIIGKRGKYFEDKNSAHQISIQVRFFRQRETPLKEGLGSFKRSFQPRYWTVGERGRLQSERTVLFLMSIGFAT